MFKKIFVLTLTLLFITLTACNTDSNSTGTVASIPSESTPNVSLEEEKASSAEEKISSIENNSSENIIVSSNPPVVSTPQTPPPTEAIVGYYTVKDPMNTRGLSSTRIGYSYGVAKDGKAHSNSINNQLKFDGMENVEALALDTVSTDKRMYLTFDCGYEYMDLTDSILNTLRDKNVKAAFFCTLDYLKKNPEKIRRMIDEGHIVGNHSTTHPDFTTISRTKMAEELYGADKYLKENYNYVSKYFRFPTGAYSENALELVTSLGYKSVFWSLAHADWDTSNQPSNEQAFTTVTNRYHSGSVILLHAVSKANTDILASLIDKAQTDGYSFKSLDEYTW